MAATPGGSRVFGTNPLAFGVPLERPHPDLVIDQASSATAFVNIARLAEQGGLIPDGWAVDERGFATQDPRRAMNGALLPFGGYKGANIALLVELLPQASPGVHGGGQLSIGRRKSEREPHGPRDLPER
jgi:(2R)-3-sulfolactate dehydrogenase (NADP+)